MCRRDADLGISDAATWSENKRGCVVLRGAVRIFIFAAVNAGCGTRDTLQCIFGQSADSELCLLSQEERDT
jgi:hypothetical protein